MTTFMKLNPDGNVSEIREIKQSDIANCPHCIFVASHYRDDGSCKCNDPHEKVMAEWGYQWDSKKGRWT